MNTPPDISEELQKAVERNGNRYIAELREWYFAPVSIKKPWKWCEEEIILNTPFARRQRVDFTGREFWKEPIDDIDDPEVIYQTKCMGTGAGKTTIDMLQLLWAFRHEPFSGIGVFPAKDGPGGATAFNNGSMIPTIEETPCFQKQIPTGERRHDFTGQKLVFAGNNFDWAGANSAAQLGNKRCRIVNLQEQDKYKENLGREAGADYLAGERTKGMSGIKIIRGSTPSLEEFGIWPHLMKSDLRRRFLNCPICNSDLMSKSKRFVLVKDRQFTVLPTKMPDGSEIPLAEFRWDKEAKRKDGSWDMDRVIHSARFECPHCGGHIQDKHRIWTDKNGLWVPTRKGDIYHRGYHLPTFYTPLVNDKYGSVEFASTFGGMAQKFLKACDSMNGVSGYINSDLAEVNAAQDKQSGSIEISSKPISQPDWVPILTADFHKNHPYIWFVVRRWCAFKIRPSFETQISKEEFYKVISTPENKDSKENIEKILDGFHAAWPLFVELMRFASLNNSDPVTQFLIGQNIVGEKLVNFYNEKKVKTAEEFRAALYEAMKARTPKGGDSELVAAGNLDTSGQRLWDDLKEVAARFEVGKGMSIPNRCVGVDCGYAEKFDREVLRHCFESATEYNYYDPTISTIPIFYDSAPHRMCLTNAKNSWYAIRGVPVFKPLGKGKINHEIGLEVGDPFYGSAEAGTRVVEILNIPTGKFWMSKEDIRNGRTRHAYTISPDVSWYPKIGKPDGSSSNESLYRAEDYFKQVNEQYYNEEKGIVMPKHSRGGTSSRLHPYHLDDCETYQVGIATKHGFFQTEIPTTDEEKK